MSTDKLLDTKLIVVDGLPGSGKSTTCQWLELQLQRSGIKARWLPEAEIPHPLWWYTQWDGATYLPPDFDQIPMTKFIETSLAKWIDFVALVQASEAVYIPESAFFQNVIADFSITLISHLVDQFYGVDF